MSGGSYVNDLGIVNSNSVFFHSPEPRFTVL